MAHKAILRILKSVTRAELERRLGGGFEAIPDAPGRRTNGHFVTFKDASQEVQERTDCYVLRLVKGAKPVGAASWTALAKVI